MDETLLTDNRQGFGKMILCRQSMVGNWIHNSTLDFYRHLEYCWGKYFNIKLLWWYVTKNILCSSSYGISNNISSPSLSDGPIRVLWTAAFSLIMVISILGNSIVLWIVTGRFIPLEVKLFWVWNTSKVWHSLTLVGGEPPGLVGSLINQWLLCPAHRRMRSVTNYFLVNLAVADMGMAMFNCIPGLVFMLDR